MLVAYRDHLESRVWFKLRDAVDARCGGICERCHQRQFENLHHLHYRTVGSESLNDVQGLCRICHETIHGLRRNDVNALTLTRDVVAGIPVDSVWYEDEAWIVLRTLITEGLNLNYTTQLQTIRRTTALRESLKDLLVSTGGREPGFIICMEVGAIPFYVSRIDEHEFKSADMRQRIITFQRDVKRTCRSRYIQKMKTEIGPSGNGVTTVQTTDPALLQILSVLTNRTVNELPAMIDGVKDQLNGRIDDVEDRVKTIQLNHDYSYSWRTVNCHCQMEGRLFNHQQCQAIGLRASKVASQRNIEPQKVPHPNYPRGLNSYPPEIINEAIIQLEWEKKL